MDRSRGNPRVADCVMRLEAQSQDKREQTRRALHDEKVRLSKSCRQIEPDRKPLWAPNLHTQDCFQTQLFAPYKFIPKYKHEELIFPDRVLERGAKRLHIKMLDTSVNIFPMSETENLSKLLRRDDKEKTIENRRLLELNRILEDCDGRFRVKRLKKKQENIFVAPTGKNDCFMRYPGYLQEEQLPESETLRKTSLARNTEKNGWRPTSRMKKQFSQTDKSQVSFNFMITKPRSSFDRLEIE